jgi:hypothetical protein
VRSASICRIPKVTRNETKQTQRGRRPETDDKKPTLGGGMWQLGEVLRSRYSGRDTLVKQTAWKRRYQEYRIDKTRTVRRERPHETSLRRRNVPAGRGNSLTIFCSRHTRVKDNVAASIPRIQIEDTSMARREKRQETFIEGRKSQFGEIRHSRFSRCDTLVRETTWVRRYY